MLLEIVHRTKRSFDRAAFSIQKSQTMLSRISKPSRGMVFGREGESSALELPAAGLRKRRRAAEVILFSFVGINARIRSVGANIDRRSKAGTVAAREEPLITPIDAAEASDG